MFGLGRPRALDRNAKVRIMHWARCRSRRIEKGRAYGLVTAKALAVLEALLWGFHNAKNGLCLASEGASPKLQTFNTLRRMSTIFSAYTRENGASPGKQQWFVCVFRTPLGVPLNAADLVSRLRSLWYYEKKLSQALLETHPLRCRICLYTCMQGVSEASPDCLYLLPT
jgi:hypothetical protein